MNHLDNLGNNFNISLPKDEDGYLGRECPITDCKGYFKITPGTGLSDIADCYCPYCGHTADNDEFHTQEQIEYAESIVIREVTDAFTKDLKSLEFDYKPRGALGIGFSMKVDPGPRHPIHYYREETLETHIECSNCTLKYAVYGVFAYCPDCGQHNSLQILNKNFNLIIKILELAAESDGELEKQLIEDALENCISAFDGFGREVCNIYSDKSANVEKAIKIRFQNLKDAQIKVQKQFNVDITQGLSNDEWESTVKGFQKRHLLAHKMGVIDREYIDKTADAEAVVGRMIKIERDEIKEIIKVLRKLSSNLFEQLNQL